MSFNGMIEVSCSQSDFYQRKILRLEDDIAILHEQLAKLRARVRIAQDFEIKYHILLEKSEMEIQKLKEGPEITQQQEQKIQKIIHQKITDNEIQYKQREQKLQQTLQKQHEEQLNQIRQERDEYRRKLGQLSVKREETESVNLKVKKLQKQNQTLQKQIEDIRIHYERLKEEELSGLRVHLNSNFKERMQAQRKMYQQKITNLQKKIIDKQVEKDGQAINLSVPNNSELISIKQLISQQSEEHQKETERLDSLLHNKNDQIKRLLQKQRQNQQKFSSQIHIKDATIAQLQNQLAKKQKDFEIQLIDLIQKSKQQRNNESNQYLEHLSQLQKDKDEENKQWANRLIHHDEQIEELKRNHKEQVLKIEVDKQDLKRKIADLSHRLQQYQGQQQAGQTQNLITSLRDLDIKKQNMANYENGITFLERQLKKCQHKLQEKSRALVAVTKQINQIRLQAQKDMDGMLQKLKQTNKQYDQHLRQLQQKTISLNSQLRLKQKQIKALQRSAITAKHQNDIQINKLKQLLVEVQKDYDRLLSNKKEADEGFRGERERALNSTGEITNARKQKWLELQRHKNQLQSLYREKQQQLKLKFEHQLESVSNDLKKISRLHQTEQKLIERLQKQNEKLREELDLDKENKKTFEYNAKIATIDLELALTQNIYNHLIRARQNPNDISERQLQLDPHIHTETQEPYFLSEQITPRNQL